MKRNNKFFSMLYVVLCLAFFYLPILVTMIFSFNSSKSLTRFTGFSLRWYQELLGNGEVIKAVYVSVTIAIIATIVSTILGTITAIGLSKSKKVIKELLLNINNIPILNPEIVTAISLMLLFSSLGFRKGYLTMLLAHIAFCTPYVITSVYPKVRALDPNRCRHYTLLHILPEIRRASGGNEMFSLLLQRLYRKYGSHREIHR